jgi:hypothetical protein
MYVLDFARVTQLQAALVPYIFKTLIISHERRSYSFLHMVRNSQMPFQTRINTSALGFSRADLECITPLLQIPQTVLKITQVAAEPLKSENVVSCPRGPVSGCCFTTGGDETRHEAIHVYLYICIYTTVPILACVTRT